MEDYGKVSIIVPIYNEEQYLDHCIVSLINQTYANIEIILVDDGSTDQSGHLCDFWAENDSRILVVHKANGGVSSARNTGLGIAVGDYLLFVDPDDWITSDTVEKALKALEMFHVDIVFFPFIRESNSQSLEIHFFDCSRVFQEKKVLNTLIRKLIGPLGDELAFPERMDWISTVWGKLYRAECIWEHGLLFTDLNKIGLYEDGLFNIDAFSNAGSVYYLDECLYHYRRMKSGQLTNTYRPNLYEQTNRLYSIMEKKCDDYSIDLGHEALMNRIALGMSAQALSITRSDESFGKKRKRINSVFRSNQYRAALDHLSISRMRLKWKLFYMICKTYNGTITLLFAEVIRWLKDKRNS